ncbi:MATE family efflux transporter [soil metagenome]
MTAPLTRRAIFAQAWPIMLGQTTVPLVGLVDTAVIGRTGDAAALAGVALGTMVINLIFWTFGFLRMGMTGMTAQAQGAGDQREVEAMLLRGIAAGFALGAMLFALQIALIPLALATLAGGGALDAAAGGYVGARFFGAPASLALFAINGWLLGLGRTRAALVLQIVMNLVNIGLDLLFVWHFHMGARGVGLGTACAEWVSLAVGLAIVGRGVDWRRMLSPSLFGAGALKRLFAVNADIMIRTIALLLTFLWFTNAGARLGETTLAANYVLLQFVSVSAFVLDGFAVTAESRVGQAIGARSRPAVVRAIRLTGEFSLLAGIGFALIFFAAGGPLIAFFATDVGVRAQAAALLPFAAIIPAIGVPAWLLDGIFIGATQGRALRNAAIVASALYIATDLLLRPFGANGIWWAFMASYPYRALALAAYLPGLLKTIEVAEPAAAT